MCFLGSDLMSEPRLNLHPPAWANGAALFLVVWLTWTGTIFWGSAQTAVVSDAWWSYLQDCDGDGQHAGALENNFARLNWFPDVSNCNGAITVYERVSYRLCGAAVWTPIYTNTAHSISGCRSSNQQYVDIQIGPDAECRDYRIEIFRFGLPIPDSVRSSTNDTHLAQQFGEWLAGDLCASDSFATCVTLSGSSGSQSDNNHGAAKEPDEPDHAGNPGGRSLWYCWTAPTNQPVTFDTLGSTFDTLLAVYAGSSVNALTMVTNSDDIAGATNRLSRIAFTPVTGQTYRIAVDGFAAASGLVVLNWNQTGVALPDLIVWGAGASPLITTKVFTANECEVLEGCATVGTRRLLRFNFETRNIGKGDLVLGKPAENPLFRFASCHGHYHFEAFAQTTLLDTNYNPVILGRGVVAGRKIGFCILDFVRWSPTAEAARKYDCKNMGLQAGWSDVYEEDLECQFVDITGVPPGSYLLQLTVNPDGLLTEADLANNTAYVPVNISPTNCNTPPANDAFTNAVTISTTPFTTSGFVNCATKQSGEPNHAGNAGGHSIWFNWTPASNHTAVVTTKRSNFDTTLAVYTGNAVNTLTLVTNSDDIVPSVVQQSLLSFNAIAGTTYRIAVDGYNSAVGTAVLNVNPPPNDDFTNAFAITGTSGFVTGHTIGASKDSSEPAHAGDVGGRSIWYRWVAPTNGFVDFQTTGSAFDTTLAVYTNTSIRATNVAIASNDDDTSGGGLETSRLFFYAKAGATYRIAVDGFAGAFGNVRLNWNMDAVLSIASLPDGNVKLGLTGVDWQRYVLLASTNLFDWFTNTPPVTMTGGLIAYTNRPLATNGSAEQKFFRALQTP